MWEVSIGSARRCSDHSDHAFGVMEVVANVKVIRISPTATPSIPVKSSSIQPMSVPHVSICRLFCVTAILAL